MERVPIASRSATRVGGPGDWLSGRAPRSHRGGHWFDPSIAHQYRVVWTLVTVTSSTPPTAALFPGCRLSVPVSSLPAAIAGYRLAGNVDSHRRSGHDRRNERAVGRRRPRTGRDEAHRTAVAGVSLPVPQWLARHVPDIIRPSRRRGRLARIRTSGASRRPSR
jgi:hypothetical protein